MRWIAVAMVLPVRELIESFLLISQYFSFRLCLMFALYNRL
jgi:hypothetical protein